MSYKQIRYISVVPYTKDEVEAVCGVRGGALIVAFVGVEHAVALVIRNVEELAHAELALWHLV